MGGTPEGTVNWQQDEGGLWRALMEWLRRNQLQVVGLTVAGAYLLYCRLSQKPPAPADTETAATPQSSMQRFINQTREKVQSGRAAEPLDKAGLSTALASDAAAAASSSLLAAPAESSASDYIPAGALCNLPSFIDFRPAAYEQILADKVRAVQATLAANQISEAVWREQMTLCRSSAANYRLRRRFAIRKLPTGGLVYAMFDHGTACIHLEAFPLAGEQLCGLMPQLLRALEEIPELVQS